MPNALGYLFLFKQKILKRINMTFISNVLVTALLWVGMWPREVDFFYRLVETQWG
jgi:hypothetical protein